MDQVGLEGVWFRNAFATNALCAPSRATLLTGVYSHVQGVISNGDGPDFRNQAGIPDGQRTWVEVQRSAGYFTGIVGKWHLRSMPTGFDHWVILPGQGVYYDPEMIANGARVKMRGHVDDVVGDQALTFLQDRHQEQAILSIISFQVTASLVGTGSPLCRQV
jgi:arylsulfatase A-like enzyme